jgi:hypothetical protein
MKSKRRPAIRRSSFAKDQVKLVIHLKPKPFGEEEKR